MSQGKVYITPERLVEPDLELLARALVGHVMELNRTADRSDDSEMDD